MASIQENSPTKKKSGLYIHSLYNLNLKINHTMPFAKAKTLKLLHNTKTLTMNPKYRDLVDLLCAEHL